MKMIVVIGLIVCLPTQTNAQEKIKTISLNDDILFTAVDRPGDFYTVTKSGQIQRFDKDGKLTLLYKAPTTPTLFDPRDGARLFVYYRNDQHYEFLNPSFEATSSHKIDPSFAIQPWLICPSGEYKLWILDKADHSLKKVNIREAHVELEVVVDSTLIQNAEVFKTMREYQSFVFLLNPDRGILIFNNLGRHIRTVEVSGIDSFNFLGEELYYVSSGNIEFFNLFTAEKRQMKIDATAADALLTDERLILINAEHLDIFAFRP